MTEPGKTSSHNKNMKFIRFKNMYTVNLENRGGMKRVWYNEKFHCWFKLTGVKLYKSRIVPLTGKAEWKYLGDIMNKSGTWNEELSPLWAAEARLAEAGA